MYNKHYYHTNGFLIIVSSPSGAGKSTICNYILQQFHNVKLSISYTTRPKRSRELNQKDYFFVTEEEFCNMISNNAFLEYAEVFGYLYGTQESFIYNNLNSGYNMLLDIDWQGAKIIKNKFQESNKHRNIISIFLLPPSMDTLRTRLLSRAQDNILTINRRLREAKEEIRHFANYDYVLINDNLVTTKQHVKSIIISQIIKSAKNDSITQYSNQLLKYYDSQTN